MPALTLRCPHFDFYTFTPELIERLRELFDGKDLSAAPVLTPINRAYLTVIAHGSQKITSADTAAISLQKSIPDAVQRMQAARNEFANLINPRAFALPATGLPCFVTIAFWAAENTTLMTSRDTYSIASIIGINEIDPRQVIHPDTIFANVSLSPEREFPEFDDSIAMELMREGLAVPGAVVPHTLLAVAPEQRVHRIAMDVIVIKTTCSLAFLYNVFYDARIMYQQLRVFACRGIDANAPQQRLMATKLQALVDQTQGVLGAAHIQTQAELEETSRRFEQELDAIKEQMTTIYSPLRRVRFAMSGVLAQIGLPAAQERRFREEQAREKLERVHAQVIEEFRGQIAQIERNLRKIKEKNRRLGEFRPR